MIDYGGRIKKRGGGSGDGSSGGGVTNHNYLSGRTLPDQHPISAITGLEEALAEDKNAEFSAFDLTDQMDGVTQEFEIPDTTGLHVALYYGGQRLDYEYAYTISGTTLTTTLDTPPTSDDNRRLMLFSGGEDSLGQSLFSWPTFADWRKKPNPQMGSGWPAFQKAANKTADIIRESQLLVNGRLTASVVTTPSQTFPGTNKSHGMVNLDDGRIFVVPGAAGLNGYVVDPDNNFAAFSVSGFSLTGTEYLYGGVLLRDGRVYCSPGLGGKPHIVDPSDNFSVTTLPVLWGGTYRSCGAVLLPNGKIFIVPYQNPNAYVVDPDDNFSAVPIPGFNGAEVANTGEGVLLPNGKVFISPRLSTEAYIVDPVALSFVTIPGFPGNHAFVKSVLLFDGRILLIPCGTANVWILDPETSQIEQIAGSFGNYTVMSGQILPDGRVFMLAWGSSGSSTSSYIVDPVKKTITAVSGFVSGGHYCAILCKTNQLYVFPYSSTTTTARVVTLGMFDVHTNFLTSPYYNH
jgi:hypothetical protein